MLKLYTIYYYTSVKDNYSNMSFNLNVWFFHLTTTTKHKNLKLGLNILTEILWESTSQK